MTGELCRLLHTRPKSNAFKTEIAQNLEKHIWPLLENGKTKPIIDQSFPLEQAMDAHLLMQSHRTLAR